MLKRYPETLRWRQALPLCPLVVCFLANPWLFWKPAWIALAVGLGLYLLIQLIPPPFHWHVNKKTFPLPWASFLPH